MDAIWEKASKALDSIPNPKDHLTTFVDKLTQVDEKVSDFLVPQFQEVSCQAAKFFQKIQDDPEVGPEWVDQAKEKIDLSKKAVDELNNCTQKVKDFLDTFQSKTNIQWAKSTPSTDWRSKYSTKDNPPPNENEPKEVWYAWLSRRLTQILEFTRDEIMPAIICYSAVPVTLVVIFTTLCPPLAHAAPGVFTGLAAGVCGLFSLNKVLPSLIDMLKCAQNKGANNISSSRIDKLKNFMSSLQKDDGN